MSFKFKFPFRLQDPKVYVQTILEVHKKYNALVLTSFKNDNGFVAALDKACGKFINTNAVTIASKSTSKSPELLAKYCDLLLKKSSKNPEEAELEDTLNQVMVVFKYIEDKDVFQKFYSKMLAKRLVNHTSASDDAEASMISKLKQACGYEYTIKLQRMFQDIGISKDLNDKFRQRIKTSDHPNEIDFSIQVLSSGSWPFNQSFNFSLPSEVSSVPVPGAIGVEGQGNSLYSIFSWNNLFNVSITSMRTFIRDASSSGSTICAKEKLWRTVSEIDTHCKYVVGPRDLDWIKIIISFFSPRLPNSLAHFKWLCCCNLMNKQAWLFSSWMKTPVCIPSLPSSPSSFVISLLTFPQFSIFDP